MAKETLRDFQGRIIGYVETYPNGNKFTHVLFVLIHTIYYHQKKNGQMYTP